MVAFSIFGINIYRYGIFYLIGFTLAYCFLLFIGKKKYFHKFSNLQNLLENDLETLFIILILGVLVGGRLGHVLIYDFQYFVNNPLDIFKIWQGGMSFIGGILGVVLGVSIFIWKKRFSRKEFVILFDLLCCILPLCIAFGRLGNFLNQELYGIIFNNPFGRNEGMIGTLTSLGFLHIYDKIDSSLRINTNLLSIIFEGLLLFISLIIIFTKQIKNDKRKIGKIGLIFLLRYSIIRFLFEYIRQDSQSEFIGPFTRSQRFFVIFIIIGLTLGICLFRHSKENLENKKIMTKKDYDEIFTKLLELFPNPDTELNFETPFQLLVAVVLSAQTTDRQVNVVTDKLFLKVKEPNDVLKFSEEDFAKQVSSVNYYKMKAKHIRETAKKLIDLAEDKNAKLTKNEKECLDKYGYYLPESLEGLTKLPGVGEKTAKVILYVRYKHDLIAVDTHVHRVANRLGIVKTNEPLETSKEIEKAIPKKWKRIAHHSLILFGRYYCTAKKPKCESCILKQWCINPLL